MNISERIDELLELFDKANAAVMAVYGQDDVAFTTKTADNSPLTEADKASHRIFIQELPRLFPGIPVVSEEGDWEENKKIVQGTTFWLVDPLDGTREFVAKSGQFCVCAALIVDDAPYFGMFSVPATGETYWGGPGIGSFKKQGNQEPQPLKVADSRLSVVLASRIDKGGKNADYINEHYRDYKISLAGSMLKFARLAEGLADVYPCIDRPLKLWDVAAGQAVVEGAGGKVSRPDGSPIDYHNQTLMAGDFVARSAV